MKLFKLAVKFLLQWAHLAVKFLLQWARAEKNKFCPTSCDSGLQLLESGWNVMAHGDAREGKWGGNWRMEWVASTLHTTSEHGVSSITTADAHTSAASSRTDAPADLNGLLRFGTWCIQHYYRWCAHLGCQ